MVFFLNLLIILKWNLKKFINTEKSSEKLEKRSPGWGKRSPGWGKRSSNDDNNLVKILGKLKEYEVILFFEMYNLGVCL